MRAGSPQADKQVLVFKTSLETIEEKENLLFHLSQLQGIVEVSVDMEDCDRVLRVVCSEGKLTEILLVTATHNIHCEELI